MIQIDIEEYKSNTNDALNLFRKRFRIFAASLLNPNKPDEWIQDFSSILFKPQDIAKLNKWIESKDHKDYTKLIEIIDFQNMKSFAIKFKSKLLIFDYDLNRLPRWLDDIATVRNCLSHLNENVSVEEIDDIDSAFRYMKRIAEYIDDTELQNGIKAIKDKLSNQKNELQDSLKLDNQTDNGVGIENVVPKELKENSKRKIDKKNYIIFFSIIAIVLVCLLVAIILYFRSKTDTTKQIGQAQSKDSASDSNSTNKNLIVSTLTKSTIVPIFVNEDPKKTITNIQYQSTTNSINKTNKVLPNSTKSTVVPVLVNEEPPNGVTNTKPSQEEDYSAYLNTSFTKTNQNIEVAVTIINPNNEIEPSVSSDIAEIYKNTGNNVNNGLIRSNFIGKPAFLKLFEGNTDIIQKLKLGNYTDYLVLGKLNYKFKQGKLVNNTIICDATLNVSEISVNDMLNNSFTVNGKGNGASESQAQEYALRDLLGNYSQDHSTLKK
jgi:hypothetical protein